MKTELLTQNRTEEFKEYCRKYRTEQDESFLYEEDLKNFIPGKDNPTCLLLEEDGTLVGAASILMDSYFRSGRKGRFRIIHTIKPSKEAFKLMLEALLPYMEDIDALHAFLPDPMKHIGRIWEELGFMVERYCYVLVREDIEVESPVFPEGMELRTFEFEKDEEAWCKVRNEAFANLKGNEIPVTPEMVNEAQRKEEYLEGGMQILWKGMEPIAVVKSIKDFDEGKDYNFIGPLAVLPDYQGMGIGRGLLRAALQLGRSIGYPNAMLCVNAENEKAVELYLKEGFKQHLLATCYKYELK